MNNEWFETAPVHKAYLKFSLPVVCGLMISLIYNMVDTWFIARTGNTDLVAGVSLGAPIFILMVALGDMFGLGGASIISRLFGRQKDDDGRKISIFCFYAAIIMGVIIAALMIVFRGPILNLLGADQDTMVYATGYYTYIALGTPMLRMQQVGMVFTAVVLVTTVIFQATGKAWGAFLLSAGRQGIIFAVVIITVSKLFGYTGVLTAQPVSDILTAMLAVGLFVKSVYKELKE